jgi:hypothetical protein
MRVEVRDAIDPEHHKTPVNSGRQRFAPLFQQLQKESTSTATTFVRRGLYRRVREKKNGAYATPTRLPSPLTAVLDLDPVLRWHRSNPSHERSYEQNDVGNQQKCKTSDAVKLRDVAVNRKHRQHGEQY